MDKLEDDLTALQSPDGASLFSTLELGDGLGALDPLVAIP